MEAFPTTTTGLVMSMFYVGFLGGCIHVDRLVAHVGHVRTFGVLASIASAAVLVHAVFVDPVAWGFLRLASGYCFAGLYVVAESWLNARATNETRGQLLSIYMIVTYLGVGGGQLLLNTASPLGCELFILTSVLISLALVPLLMSAGPTGSVRQSTRVSLRELMRLSPLGTAGAFAVGITSGTLFSMGPVYAGTAGLSVADTSLFMAAAVTGTIILQWPIGRSSDVFDRRKVIALVTFAAAGVALGAPALSGYGTTWIIVAVGLYGGLALPLYALTIAHASDYLEPDKIVAASAALVLVNGFGAVVGPLASSVAMTYAGNDGFYWTLAVVHVGIGVFALYRMTRRASPPPEEQAPYAPAAPQTSQVAIEWSQHAARSNPDTPDEDSN